MTPPPIPATMRPRPAVSRSLLWTIIARALMLVMFLASIGLVGWSLFQFHNVFPPMTRQIRLKDSERSNLATEVQQQEASWDAAATERLEVRYQAARERLFTNSAEQASWSEDLRTRARELAFDANLIVEAPQDHPATNHHLALVHSTLTLAPAKLARGVTNSPYERLLVLAEGLEDPKRRIDFLELSVTSDSNSVHRTQARFDLWTQKTEKKTP